MPFKNNHACVIGLLCMLGVDAALGNQLDGIVDAVQAVTAYNGEKAQGYATMVQDGGAWVLGQTEDNVELAKRAIDATNLVLESLLVLPQTLTSGLTGFIPGGTRDPGLRLGPGREEVSVDLNENRGVNPWNLNEKTGQQKEARRLKNGDESNGKKKKKKNNSTGGKKETRGNGKKNKMSMKSNQKSQTQLNLGRRLLRV